MKRGSYSLNLEKLSSQALEPELSAGGVDASDPHAHLQVRDPRTGGIRHEDLLRALRKYMNMLRALISKFAEEVAL
jgi:hypothetical protein